MTTNLVSCDCFGFTGSTGPRGVPGLVGAQGPQGKKGDVGPRGPPGIGVPGQAGYPGPAGPPGSAGPPGPAGPYGMAGPQGHLGPQGAQGVIGVQGAIGQVGPQGPMGFQGAQGVGMAGAPGVMGCQGAMGAQGPPGEMGCFNFIAEGADSPTGPASSTAIVKEGDVLRIWSAGGFDVGVESGSALINLEPANLIVLDGPPVDTPKDPTRSALYLDRTSGGAIYLWNPTDVNWDQITAGGGIAGPNMSETGPYTGDAQGNIQPTMGFNDASGSVGNSTIAGGMSNIASGNSSFVGAGQINMASGDFSSVLSGTNSVASGEYAIAMGKSAVASNDGAVVLSDRSGLGVSSTADDQFTALMSGGFRFLGGAGAEIDGDLVVDGDGSFTGAMMVGGTGSFGGDMSVGGDLVVGGGLSFGGGGLGTTGSLIPSSLIVDGDLTVNGDGSFEGSLDVGGGGQFGGDLGATGSLEIGEDGQFGGGLSVGGDGQFGGDLGVTGDGSFDGSLVVDGSGIFGGDLVVDGKLTVGGLIDPIGLVLDGQVTPPSSLSGSEGLIWVDSNFSGTRLSYRDNLNQDFQMVTNPVGADLDFAGFSINNLGNLGVGGNLDVTGNGQFDGNLGVTGIMTVGMDGSFGGDLQVGGKLTVGGLIDPTGLVLDGQASAPASLSSGEGLVWVDNTSSPSQLRFRDDGNSDRQFVNNPLGANLDCNSNQLTNVGSISMNGQIQMNGQFINSAGQINLTSGSGSGIDMGNKDIDSADVVTANTLHMAGSNRNLFDVNSINMNGSAIIANVDTISMNGAGSVLTNLASLDMSGDILTNGGGIDMDNGQLRDVGPMTFRGGSVTEAVFNIINPFIEASITVASGNTSRGTIRVSGIFSLAGLQITVVNTLCINPTRTTVLCSFTDLLATSLPVFAPLVYVSPSVFTVIFRPTITITNSFLGDTYCYINYLIINDE